MSQAGSLKGAGGGGGGVTTVEGTDPIKINGVSGLAQSGAVVVSIDPIPSSQFVIFTDPTATIDFTQIQTVSLYTPNNDFSVQSIVIVLDSQTGIPDGITYSVGTNGPTYNNISGSSGQSLDPLGTFTQFFNFSKLVPAATPIFINITSGDLATTATGRVFLTGVLL
tara:strand:- start:269 stop:769 length:501 start_codon:yes stop_codon:yes gene_type:complete